MLLLLGHDPLHAVPIRRLPLAQGPATPDGVEEDARQGRVARRSDRVYKGGPSTRHASKTTLPGLPPRSRPRRSAAEQQEQDQDHEQHQNNDIQLDVVALLGHLHTDTRTETTRRSARQLAASKRRMETSCWTHLRGAGALGRESIRRAAHVVVDLVQQPHVQLRLVLHRQAVRLQVRHALADQVELLVLVYRERVQSAPTAKPSRRWQAERTFHDLVLHAQQLLRVLSAVALPGWLVLAHTRERCARCTSRKAERDAPSIRGRAAVVRVQVGFLRTHHASEAAQSPRKHHEASADAPGPAPTG